MASPSPCSHHEGAAMKEISRALDLISRLQEKLGPSIPLIQADGELELASYLCQEAIKSLSLSLAILQSRAAQVASEKMKSIHEDDGGHVKLIRGHKTRRHITSEPYFDGYQWKKYGQKTIKNCMFQRSYYKCINRGCKATKTVQQMNCGEPPNFLVGYDMQHSCKVAETNQNLTMDSTSTRVVRQIIESNSLMKNMINKLVEASSPNSLFQTNMYQETSSPNSHFQNNMDEETPSPNSHFQNNMEQETPSPNSHFQNNMNQETSSPNSHFQTNMNQETSSTYSHFQNNINQDCNNSCEESTVTQAQAADNFDHFRGIFMPQMFSPICQMYSDEELESAWLMETFRSHEVDSFVEDSFSFDLS